MERPPAIEKRVSSGGVIFRRAGASVRVALVAVRGMKSWCLPKGMIDEGEDAPAAALREVREETGLQGKLVQKLGQISYWYHLKGENIRVNKTVHFYLLKYVSGRTGDHDHEVDEAKWLDIDDAIKLLTYKNEKGIMTKARDAISRLKDIA